ncbi:MAG: hypothetical protein ACOX08_10470 [Methanobacterium sp.]|jgi:hypothetical protein|nr:hypothetical protein [Methanobacterium sp.]
MIKPNQIMIKSGVRDKKSDKLMIRSNTTLDLFFPLETIIGELCGR